MKQLSAYSMLGKSCRLTSASGRPDTSPCTVATRSPHGPSERQRRRGGPILAPRAASVSARSARAKARSSAALSPPRPEPAADERVRVLRRPAQRLAARTAEPHERIDRPGMEPMRPEIDGVPAQRHGHGAPADALARLQHRDREPAREAAGARRDAGRAGADDRDVRLAAAARQEDDAGRCTALTRATAERLRRKRCSGCSMRSATGSVAPMQCRCPKAP